jgi:type II secretory pathway pseudopilin PulG
MRTIPTPRRPHAFTLIEVLIIATILSILAGIGIISANTFISRARVRAVIGETYQLATGISFARDDIGFYPKLGFLDQPISGLGENSSFAFLGPGNPLIPDFDVYGFDVSAQEERVSRTWNGPYIGLGVTRSQLGEGNPSLVSMRLPESGEVVTWPGDSWRQPYIHYQVSVSPNRQPNDPISQPLPAPGFPTWHTGPEFFGKVPDYFNGVVSYGPNQVPGGDTIPPTVGQFLAGVGVGGNFDDPATRAPLRLFEVIDSRTRQYEALPNSAFDTSNLATQRLAMIFAFRDPSTDDLIREF